MNVKVTFPKFRQIEWHRPPENPDHDGHFWAINRWLEFDSRLDYTVEAGWNTHRDYDGNLFKEAALDDNYVLAWTEPITPILEVLDK